MPAGEARSPPTAAGKTRRSGTAPADRESAASTALAAADAHILQRQLDRHGACSMLDLLVDTNRLDYERYRAWRRGRRPTLDDALVGGAAAAGTFMEDAAAWARSLNLSTQATPLYGVDECAGAELTASADPKLDACLRMEFQPASNRTQLDLFLDTAEAEAAAAVAAALATRDEAAARARLERLLQLNPHHWSASDAQSLVDALAAPAPRDRDQALEQLRLLEDRWLPAACALLRKGARDFLAPRWRAVGAALAEAPFAAAAPRQHASWAHLNGLDWEGARSAVLREASHLEEPILVRRLALAEWRLRRYHVARDLWFRLCVRAPEHFAESVARANFPAAELKKAWLAAQQEAIEPPISPPWFPAWAALQDLRAARHFARLDGDGEPERAFNLLVELAQGRSDREDLNGRRALQAIHQGLFERYLEKIGT